MNTAIQRLLLAKDTRETELRVALLVLEHFNSRGFVCSKGFAADLAQRIVNGLVAADPPS